jgi:Glycine rich protein
MRRSLWLVLALGLLVCAVFAQSASATIQAFSFTGGEQSFTVPAGVSSLQVLAVGAKGGMGFHDGSNVGGSGGFGDRVEASLPVKPGEVLFVEVGGTGADGVIEGAGGFNGGGSSNGGDFGVAGGGGGGATDLRTCSMLAASCEGTPNTLNSRLLVAGGGGGGSNDGRQKQATGGEGGDAGKDGKEGQPLECGAGTPGGGGEAGSQTAGGTGGLAGSNGAPAGNPGAVATGGEAGTGGANSQPGGGGGGGFFGGGSGGSGNGCAGGGGGGGSSLAPTGASIVTDTSGTPLVAISYTLLSPPSPTTGNPAPPAQATKATVSALREANSTFTVGNLLTPLNAQTSGRHHKQGTSFSFSLDQPATMKIVIQRNVKGRRVGHSCKPRSPRLLHRPSCLRLVTVGTLTRTAHAGLNKVAFTGRIGTKALKPGSYVARFIASDAAGTSGAQTLTFSIVSR